MKPMPWFKAPGGAHASHLTLTRTATLVLAQALALGLIGAGNAVAAPVLRCEIEANNTMHRLETGPVTDPYPVSGIDIEGHFRFKAVMVGDAGQVEYIRIYVHATHAGRRQPLHTARYEKPILRAAAPPPPADALTGTQAVFAPHLQRELQYRCVALETTP